MTKIDIDDEVDRFEKIKKRWDEWCLSCKHSYRKKGDADYLWCRLRKRQCPFIEVIDDDEN